jgi:adenylate cyclase
MEKDVRQLAAVMLTDVVGYTALTQTDEALTLTLLEDHAAILRPLFAEHGGREVKGTGDGFLVEFLSALQAVHCAVEIQRALHERNAAVPPERAITLRIGVHLGDVVHRGGDIFGDGVNITARIEPLAKPGGICISRQVYDQVWNKTDVQLQSLGKKDLKNVKVQIEVFEMLLPWLRSEISTQPGAHRSRLAVLPLLNMSPDPSDEYIADGLTEELIFTLSRVSRLQVIALTSVMQYRGAKKGVSQIGKELSVGAVLEGSVRKTGDRLRITLQLIDTSNEAHLWAEAYDRTMSDVFAVQMEIARSVAAALEVRIFSKRKRTAAELPPPDPKAYAAYLKGRALLSGRHLANIRAAIESLQESVALDPSRAESHATLALARSILVNYASSSSHDTWAEIRAGVLRALALDPDLPEAHAVLGIVLESAWDWDGAERELRRAIELLPGYAQAHHWLGLSLLTRARFDEAVAALRASISLDPLSAVQHEALGQAYLWKGEPALALQEFELGILLGGDNHAVRMFRALAHLEQGKAELAKADVERARELADPGDPEIELAYAQVLEALGETQAVEAALERALAASGRSLLSPYLRSLYSFALGRANEGFALLERAVAERDYQLVEVATDPRLAAYRADPRYSDILRKVGLALPNARRRDVSAD